MKSLLLGFVFSKLWQWLFGPKAEKQEDEPVDDESSWLNPLSSFLFGCLLGGVLTAVTTPVSGSKLRKKISGGVKSANKTIESNLRQTRKRLRKMGQNYTKREPVRLPRLRSA